MKKIKLEDIMEILNAEIKWCNEHPDKAFHTEYRKGFINGLIQSKYLINEFAEVEELLR